MSLSSNTETARRSFLESFLKSTVISGSIGVTNDSIADIIDEKSNALKKSKDAIGENEFKFFLDFFGLTEDDKEKIHAKITEIQKEGKIKSNGIIKDSTLIFIYSHYYSKSHEKLGLLQKRRLEIEKDMKGYKNKQGTADGRFVMPVAIPDVWSSNRFFGGSNNDIIGRFEPIGDEGNEYVNKRLFSSIEWDALDAVRKKMNGNFIYIFQVGSENVLALFDNDGNLKVLTVTSPGQEKFPSLQKEMFKNLKALKNINHISSSYPDDTEEIGGAPLPYTINIKESFKIHGTAEVADGKKRSHGCFRVPLYYIKELYEYTRAFSPNLVIGNLGYKK